MQTILPPSGNTIKILGKVLKQCSISTILVFVGQLVGSLLGSSCFTGTSIRPNL